MKKHDVSLILILVIGFSLSLTAFVYVKNWGRESVLQDKRLKTDGYVRSLRQTFLSFSSVLYSTRGLYNIHNGLDHADFKNFFKQNTSILGQDILQGVAWVPSVAPPEVPYVTDIAQRDNPTLHFWELGADGQAQSLQSRPVHYPILYLESSKLSTLAGFDLASNPQLRQTLELARNQSQLLMSDATYLPASSGNVLGVYLVLPVYLREVNTIPERQRELRGFIVGIVVLEPLIDQELRPNKLRSDTFWKVTDETPNTKITQLYTPSWLSHEHGQTATELVSTPLEFSDFGKRSWRIGLYSLQGETSEIEWRYAWIVLLTGILFS
ncbi:MAG: CHASE domain-containing protein [Thiotrichaceae bacterium]|nr:CHASE domain-containing protein [Thiotrichaceae bacterium]